MDATALTVYKYLDTFIAIPSFRDGYPRGLGTSVVQKIPTEPNEFQSWLGKTRKSFMHFLDILKCVDSKSDNGYLRGPFLESPVTDEKVRWIYTIDLDDVVFSVDNGAHFRLDNIARGEDGEEWTRYLGQDGSGRRCLKTSTPRSFVAYLRPSIDPDATMTDVAAYREFDAMVVAPEEWSEGHDAGTTAPEAVTLTVVKALIGHFYSTLCNACRFEPSDPRFQGPAQWLLQALAPNFLNLRIERESDRDVSRINERSSRSRRGLSYWFRGCLVTFSTRLDLEEQLQASVARVVASIRDKGLQTCTAIVWSILHVVVVRISNDHIERTAALPVLDAYETDERAFQSTVYLLARCLRPHCVELTGFNSSIKPSPVPPVLPRVDETRVSLPTDIILEIMKYVDSRTYFDAFSGLSRTTRATWGKRCRIGSYTIYGVELNDKPCYGRPEISSMEEWEEPSCLAYAEDGRRICLKLVYEGHPFLGNRKAGSVYSNPELEMHLRVGIKWPCPVNEEGGGGNGIEGWLEVRHCGLYLQLLS